ncbi:MULTISPECIES: N-acetylmuramoyl-L-alanine amidase family protein [Clostridium]|uniref:N-acetylmuramoyl-L-alanine amidase family protein n=1 Tax=Clostridium TaxID=1485 RepID=UPI0002C924E9|nr:MULTISPECIES: N-acetylmuramoyl-L-alanine amidase family protein [Clostridium]ALS18130.1 glycosyl hydrolase family 32 [Clostridium butyricum]EMU55875.1 glycosyl hydrolase family 32, N domain protein [Clostridium butyricum DKU-01]MDB2158947.1 N-acetylmuramoyl-L-alanine amidase family protein [Clostridium butyricum]MDM8133307.1 N-acetylmuramoyl-L-alanine amidase family protein [Clostridium butyricum]MDM8231569.1 N-acetylmuramoyl-L-alanine amidase family protein [Clostridium butyricum]
MKGLNLKKLVAMALTLATVTAVSPVAASAAWKQDAKGWWNTEGNSWSIGWRQIDGTWYHFDETGYMSTGWVIDYSAGYGQWYFMDQSGAMKTGWMQDAGKWYFLQPSGAMKTGWINDAGTWYFAEASGSMLTGVIKVDGQTYYLQSNGAMATGEVEINGTKYTFAANGACVGDAPKADKVFGTTDSGNNSGSSNTDKDTDSDSGSSSGGSSHGGGGSSSSTPAAIKDYSTSANITVENVSDKEADVDTYKVTFNKTLTQSKEGDYAVRDLYVTNEDAVITEEEDGYLVSVKKGSTLDAKGVIRVIRAGKVYYATGIAVTK